MTVRSIAIGLLLAAALCAVSYFNDSVIRQTRMVSSYMPTALLGVLILLVLAVNPLLAFLRRRLTLTGRELAAILMILLVAGAIPSMGLMNYFTNVCMMPHAIEANRLSWQRHRVIGMIPRQMLADPTVDNGGALRTFLAGRESDSHETGLDIVPWRAWTRTLWFWLPVVVSISVALMGLALVLHQQWSAHEKLRYPLAGLAAAFMPEEGQTLAPLFRRRAFWLGALAVLACYMANYAHAWWPGRTIEIPLGIDLSPLNEWSRVWKAGDAGEALLTPRVYFTAIGFAFFLASDLSLSLAVAPILYTLAVGAFVTAGVTLEGPHMTANPSEFMYAGAWAGMALILLYTGRRYYAQTLVAALSPGRRSGVQAFSVWGLRTYLAGAAVFVVLLTGTGLSWALAILYTLAATVMFVVISRIVAETGAFYLHPWHFPEVTLFGFLGIEAIGQRNYLIMMMVTTVILLNPRVSLMPLVVQGLKVAQLKGLRPGPTAALGVPALLLALAIAVPTTLYWQYDKGVNAASDGWARDWAPQFAISAFLNMKDKYEAAHGHELADAGDGPFRIGAILPDKKLMLAFGATLGLVLLLALARLRFPWWPLHPILLVMMGTWQTKVMAFSFLLGWLVKTGVTRLAGHDAYERLKPLMIGLIAGEVLAAAVTMIVGAVYYLATGRIPVSFGVV